MPVLNRKALQLELDNMKAKIKALTEQSEKNQQEINQLKTDLKQLKVSIRGF